MAESNNDALADFPSLAGMAAELGDDIRVAPAAAATSPLPKKRFSWRKIKLAFVGRAAYKDSDSARVDAALLPGGGSNGSTTSTAADDRIPSPSVSAVATPSDPSAAAAAAAQGGQVVLKTLRRFSAAVTRSLAGEGSNTPTGSHSSSGRRGSTASTTTVGGTHAGSAGMMTGSSSSSSDLRQGTPIEVEILAMVAAAKDADPVRFRNVVAPRDVFVNERGEHVVVFDALLELPLRDVSLRRAAELSRQLFSALEAIHALGVVHLDVNPSNLMQDADGNLILIDFGLSRVCDGTPHPPGRGTRGYIAPELFPPNLSHSTTPDMYSAGLVVGLLLEPYLAHLNLRILGGSASYPVHVDAVWESVREFVEIDCVQHDDLFPPILQLAADLLLRLLTRSTPSTPVAGHRYLRLTAAQAKRHPFLAVLENAPLAEKSFRFMTPGEWRLRRAGDQLKDRQRRRGVDFWRLA